MNQRPVPFRLALFLQALASRLTGEQLEQALREVTHFQGDHRTPALDDRQLRIAEALTNDVEMARAYGFDLQEIERKRRALEQRIAICANLLQTFDPDHYGRNSKAIANLENARDRIAHEFEQQIERLKSFAADLRAMVEQGLPLP